MAYEIYDEVTADSLEPGDLIQIEDAATDELVFLFIQATEDLGVTISVSGLGVDDEVQYIVSLDPDDAISLYSEVDED